MFYLLLEYHLIIIIILQDVFYYLPTIVLNKFIKLIHSQIDGYKYAKCIFKNKPIRLQELKREILINVSNHFCL